MEDVYWWILQDSNRWPGKKIMKEFFRLGRVEITT